jgi:hypothetical protein
LTRAVVTELFVNPEKEKLLNAQVVAGCALAATANTKANDNNRAGNFMGIEKVKWSGKIISS